MQNCFDFPSFVKYCEILYIILLAYQSTRYIYNTRMDILFHPFSCQYKGFHLPRKKKKKCIFFNIFHLGKQKPSVNGTSSDVIIQPCSFNPLTHPFSISFPSLINIHNVSISYCGLKNTLSCMLPNVMKDTHCP